MKFLFLLLSSFMLYMSCMPCSDNNDCTTNAELNISAYDHTGHNHNTESCTPFCTCSCCAATVFFMPSIKATFSKEIFHAINYPMYKVPFNAEVHYSIWQPPQIV